MRRMCASPNPQPLRTWLCSYCTVLQPDFSLHHLVALPSISAMVIFGWHTGAFYLCRTS
ncbi:hypothetical protein BD414DRAFT_487515 [Trametes punicea]|nr:hypothetical protein BD414DRAFT_487515 [Trametes punicea]